MYCDCVRVVQSNLTALYLFFLFLFLFVMYVYILCKEGRKFKSDDENNIFRAFTLYSLYEPLKLDNHLFARSKIQNNRDFDFPQYKFSSWCI